ncbi:hypothetical protein [Pseudoalteromonas sp. SCQQ13]|uniref:hypothetical protein n=1 Tax=Pseudoalteromonas sp. SCQQ13 TaxID=2792066 RepID=UPI0018CFEAAF|nr:hypothetical protein [Pseudoalteromonas sp. SCQQ13]MBH0093315.1 hypothetical protein [Pseudoalteromonas sp. SCQQ13]
MDVIEFLESNYEIFLGWECSCPRISSAREYDPAIYKMRDVLRKYSLIGYHCTKLTVDEIKEIRTNGMLLQNAASLKNRVSCLKDSGLLSADIAQELMNRNQADDGNRANMLWFCFFEPYLAGRSGIERFFRSWGGEALYNSHEDHPVTGNALFNIGTPCVIKAKVPIASLRDSYYPDSSMIRAFLSKRGHQLENEIEHEGFSSRRIDPQNIIEIVEYPSDQFNALTKCDTWDACDATL